jgi:CRP/FNR family cyclic AMP-dependent transcriptional regulator
MQWVEIFGYLGALLTVATFSMKTMLHLRVVGIVANLAFISYGATAGVYPVLLLHLVLLPLNLMRLRQLLVLTRQVQAAAKGDFRVEWLKPFTRRRAWRAGETLFKLGDAGDEVMFVLSGGFRAVEADAPLAVGEVIGELGLISTGNRRTQTVVCEADGEMLLITYDEVRQLYFQNPSFGFYLLQLAARHLQRHAGLPA